MDTLDTPDTPDILNTLEVQDQNQETYNNISWLDKYRPSNLDDYYISKEQLDVVKTWIDDFRNNTEDAKPFLILYGTPGIGKTTLAYLILNFYDYEIIECNASDSRTKKNIRETLGQISKVTVCIDDDNNFKKLAIIMDEIDGLVGGESNSVQELIDIVTKDKDAKTSSNLCPVICTTNSIKDKKLQPLIKQGVVLNIDKPNQSNCRKLINKIATAENIVVPESIILDIITKSNGDYRQIILLLFEFYHNLKIVKVENNTSSNTSSNNTPSNNTSRTILTYEDNHNNFEIIKKICNICETPLDKINYLLTNNIDIDNICHICSDDSNLYYMNFYINIISILILLQNKYKVKNKDSLLLFYNLLYKLYDLIKEADLYNNSIFLEKKWELLEYFDIIGISIPLKMLHDQNLSNSNNSSNSSKYKYIINDFQLSHHTQYNFMRQEQSMIKKKLNIDYMQIFDIDLTNIYYNLKRFKHQNSEAIIISDSKTKKKKTNSSNSSNSSIIEKKFQIDKTYIKILSKIDELLA